MSINTADKLHIYLVVEEVNQDDLLYRVEKISFQGNDLDLNDPETNDVGVTSDTAELHWPIQLHVREQESSTSTPDEDGKVVFVKRDLSIKPLDENA